MNKQEMTLDEWCDELPKFHLVNCELQEIRNKVQTLTEELRVTDRLLNERNKVIDEIPECKSHGGQCIPHCLDWVESCKHLETRKDRLWRAYKELLELWQKAQRKPMDKTVYKLTKDWAIKSMQREIEELKVRNKSLEGDRKRCIELAVKVVALEDKLRKVKK